MNPSTAEGGAAFKLCGHTYPRVPRVAGYAGGVAGGAFFVSRAAIAAALSA